MVPRQPRAMASALRAPTQPLLVLGVLADERRPRYRERLREYYAQYSDRVLVRYILDERWLSDHPKYIPAADEISVRVGREHKDQHCAHKMIGWWSTAARWPGTFYAKTDDDVMIDLARIVPLLESLPSDGLYGGILRYSSINESSLEGQCWSAGAFGALRRRISPPKEYPRCGETRGPIVFAEGPFVLMSHDVQKWVSPKLSLDERQRCHYEDLLLGRELAHRPSMRLTNLGGLIADPNVWDFRGRWQRVHGPLAHWTRTDEAFNHTASQFARTARIAPTNVPMPKLACTPWLESFPRLVEFPCCRNWTLCESADALKEWKRLRKIYLNGPMLIPTPRKRNGKRNGRNRKNRRSSSR